MSYQEVTRILARCVPGKTMVKVKSGSVYGPTKFLEYQWGTAIVIEQGHAALRLYLSQIDEIEIV